MPHMHDDPVLNPIPNVDWRTLLNALRDLELLDTSSPALNQQDASSPMPDPPEEFSPMPIEDDSKNHRVYIVTVTDGQPHQGHCFIQYDPHDSDTLATNYISNLTPAGGTTASVYVNPSPDDRNAAVHRDYIGGFAFGPDEFGRRINAVLLPGLEVEVQDGLLSSTCYCRKSTEALIRQLVVEGIVVRNQLISSLVADV